MTSAKPTVASAIVAVVYGAKSTSDPGGSIPTQIADCQAMAVREGWTVAGTYSDEDASAYHGNRGDGLAQARDHAERPEEWHRIQRERSARARRRGPSVGRPPTALLARLARCECGPAMVIQRGGRRMDGTRKRTYVCTTHMHRRDDCTVTPFNADEAEGLVLGGMNRLLRAGTAWADAVLAGRQADRLRIESERDAAQGELRTCTAAIAKLADAYGAATLSGDASQQELASMALAKRRAAL